MKRKTTIFLAAAGVMALAATAAFAMANPQHGGQEPKNVEMTQQTNLSEVPAGPTLDIATTAGDIKIRLYDDTPLHRDNFLKLAKEGYYDGVLFHRVINDFMVQTGDPESKDAPKGTMLGSGGPGYTVPAEIVYPKHYHKYGALAAARTGDEMNPERKSSGSQIYRQMAKSMARRNFREWSRCRCRSNCSPISWSFSARIWTPSGSYASQKTV